MRLPLAALLALWAGVAGAERLTEAPLVGAEWLAAQDPAALTVIDIRSPDRPETDHALGHIPGALSAPFDAFDWDVDFETSAPAAVADLATRICALGIGTDRQVVIVTDGLTASDFARAARVYWTFHMLGHKAVTVLDGGHLAWTDEGLPLETGPVPPPAVQPFAPGPAPAALARTDEVLALLGQAQLLGARSAAEFTGQRKSGLVQRAGTLPGAVSLPVADLYDERVIGAEALQALLAERGIGPGPTMVFCNLGHLSALDWFVLTQVAGLPDVRLYDGSMQVWTADPARPVQGP